MTINSRTIFPLYDLHSHTCASDGKLTPQQLVLRACEMRVNVLAITDHDTVAGMAEAQRVIAEYQLPLRLIPGVEISTLWEDHEIHIVGLGIDIRHPALAELLEQQNQHRMARAALISQRLQRANIPGAFDAVLRLAAGGVVTRGHFARYLMELGKGKTMAQVFKHYLARGKTGYAAPQWCSILQATEAIHLAGGCTVLAHPGRYDLSTKWLKRLLTFFADAKGDAIEVAQCQQSLQERQQLAQYAQTYQLAASQGSDFHQPCPWTELGRKLWLPAGVEAVWTRYPHILHSAPLMTEV